MDLKFITHLLESEWGSSLYVMEENGNAYARAYWFKDDKTTIYLDSLSVNSDSRNKGIGLKLQEYREQYGISNGYITSCLWVKKGTWMHEWYKRRGYIDYIDHKNEIDCIWMKKKLA